MKPAEMLHVMCQNELSTADMKAISKKRGFSAQETGSRALFENFFLSSVGVEAALNTLTKDEIALLHLMHFKGEAVPVHFFERIYKDANTTRNYQYGTYNQIYKSVFSQVKTRLIRSGVLMYAELGNISAGKTKLERQRFYFPDEFVGYLPRLTQPVTIATKSGTVRDGFRPHLSKLAQPVKRLHRTEHEPTWIILENGDLMLGKDIFQTSLLSEWRQQAWEREVWRAQLSEHPGRSPGVIFAGYQFDWDDSFHDSSPVPFVRHIMNRLKPNEWLSPNALTPLLRIFYGQNPPLQSDRLCTIGWEQGCLARHQHQKQAVYRPISTTQFQPETLDPAVYFHIENRRKTVIIDLEKVPYESLETINYLAELTVNRDKIEAKPDVIRISEAPITIRENPITEWLVEKSTAFRDALDTVTSQWGRLIVHENVLVARITDLSLRVMIEKKFEGQIILLEDKFIAFPYCLRRDIEKAVDKAGHVIKVVKS